MNYRTTKLLHLGRTLRYIVETFQPAPNDPRHGNRTWILDRNFNMLSVDVEPPLDEEDGHAMFTGFVHLTSHLNYAEKAKIEEIVETLESQLDIHGGPIETPRYAGNPDSDFT